MCENRLSEIVHHYIKSPLLQKKKIVEYMYISTMYMMIAKYRLNSKSSYRNGFKVKKLSSSNEK